MKENTFKDFMKKWIFWYILIYTIEALAIISGYLYATPKGERKEEVNKALCVTISILKTVPSLHIPYNFSFSSNSKQTIHLFLYSQFIGIYIF